MNLEHLILDKKFVLRTDSKILSKMNTEHKEKIKRWKIAIQHYNFDLQHILGKYNVEADALSRLVPLPERNAEVHVLEQSETIQKTKKLDPNIYEIIKSAH